MMEQMQPLKAHMENGQVVLDEPADLPDGFRLQVVPATEEAEAELDQEIDEAWRAEVRRRSEDLHAGRMVTTPWEQVRRELLGTE